MPNETPRAWPPAYGPIPLSIAGRVCYVLNHSFPFSANGYAVRSHGVAVALVEHGLSVLALNRPGSPWDLPGFPAHGNPSFHDQDGVRYVFTPLARFESRGTDRWLAHATEELVDHFETFRPTAVIAASNWENALPALGAARQLGLPYFYEVRGFWELSQSSIDEDYLNSPAYRMAVQQELEVARSAHRVFTLNALMRDELVRRGVPAAKIDVVPNAISRLPALSRHFADSGKEGRKAFRIGYIGSFSEYEGLDDLITAVHGLRAAGWDVTLRLVGSSNSAGVSGLDSCATTESLRQQASQLGIGRHVQFVGRVSPSEVSAQYDQLDLFVLPRKPLPVCEIVAPLKPLEAAAHGCPMLASDVAPLAEIAPAAGIRLFQKGNVQSLQDEIASLLANAEARLRMGAQARAWVARERLFKITVAPMVAAIRRCESGPATSMPSRDAPRAVAPQVAMPAPAKSSHRPEADPTRAASRLLRRLSVGRFQVSSGTDGTLECVDALVANPRVVRADAFRDLKGADRAIELVRRGFLPAALACAGCSVASRPRDGDDAFFWQFPARTEGAAWDLHTALDHAVLDGKALHVYLGLPWATWIDMASRRTSPLGGVLQELRMQRVRIEGYRKVLGRLGFDLRLHTVCQHVQWRSFLSHWRDLSVTDLWLSHAPDSRADQSGDAIEVHPWHLHAVNIETAGRTTGLRVGVDPAQKTLLASFIGTHANHYVSSARLRIQALADAPGFHVKLTDRWHLEDVVYQHQIRGASLPVDPGHDESVRSYNEVLSDSRFSLCPAGAGPNSLRLWESLAVGSVPVLLGPAPALPRGGTLQPIDWEAIVMRVPDEQIPDLPRILGDVPIEEIRRRQQLGMRAYHWVRAQRCF